MIWALLPIGFVYLILRFWFKRQKLCRDGKVPGKVVPRITTVLENPDGIAYNIKHLQAPKLTGVLFRLLIWLGYTRFGSVFITSKLKRDNASILSGVYIPEKPVMMPTSKMNRCRKDHSKENNDVIQELVENEVRGRKGEGFSAPSVSDFVRAYRTGDLTPTDVARAVLKAIEDSDKAVPPLRAIVQTNKDVVLAMAEASTQRWKTGKPISLVDGVPFCVKEEFRVEPYEFKAGSVVIPTITNGVPESVAARKLTDKGAIMIGMSNMQEFGLGTLGSNPNSEHLTARNAYNKECYPGGSSSGSAVAVAAGLCPISIGADGGGSVRIPAALCGIVGLKPTFSLLDSEGQFPQDYSVGVAGPLCSSVLDTAIAMNIISKDTDSESIPLSLAGLGEDNLNDLNIGVYWEYLEHADPEIVNKCKEALSKMESLGAKIVPIKIPELEESRVAHTISIISEFTNALAVDVDKHHEKLNLESHVVLNLGTQFTAIEYLNAQKQRARAITALKHLFEDCKIDVIATPATGCPAPKIHPSALECGELDASMSSRLMQFAFLANLVGNPGLVVPVGYTSGSLPIGIQFMADFFQEHTLLKIGWALEKQYSRKKPQVFYDVLQKQL